MRDRPGSFEPAGAEPPLYHRIVGVLSTEISAGLLESGARLLESRVASRFGVSRAPARQALAELAAEGFIVQADAPSRGYVVAATRKRSNEPAATAQSSPVSFETRPTWQRIYAEAEEAITSRIAFGDWRVTETALGSHFGVSRTVAREVLARLQSRGLVMHEGKRWIAPQLSDRRVHELYELRAVLEPAALESAVDRLSPSELGRMTAALRAAMEDAPSAERLDGLERELHFGLIGRCGNGMLRQTMLQTQSLLLAHRFFYRLTANMYRVEPFLGEHLDVLERLRLGRLPEAQRSLRAHLMASSERAVERIANVRGLVRLDPISFLDPIRDGSTG